MSDAGVLRLQVSVDRRMASCDGLRSHCARCLDTGRWGGSVVLMVVDAAFMSIGLNYFTSVVPAVARYEEGVREGRLPAYLRELSHVPYDDVASLWKNRRSWHMAREVAACLTHHGDDNVNALRSWAAKSSLQNWQHEPIGSVSGVGINTYQYLRMMGGVDTSMPDKIVRRVIAEIVAEAGVPLATAGDFELIETIGHIADITGHRPIELCWMTWMIQSEGKTMRMDKYRDLLQRI
jgi:hypothetical protein